MKSFQFTYRKVDLACLYETEMVMGQIEGKTCEKVGECSGSVLNGSSPSYPNLSKSTPVFQSTKKGGQGCIRHSWNGNK